ncbi:polysaccharide deacetylase family protein [Synechococcus sp. Cruz-9H2]|uniref:polysaccharide deacetylase family protein n=1 Tax=unclassified Synechococcus TaxID=2626047 RepID=UPI0020CC9922|nr:MULTISPECIES: polysaccharide deacetylase family protein [unclassified Synechococcus]MCP9819628.1 polysaccharide deacetylase family protein [Synechococcus sp. Cruz-9H2]MCP9843933.1 polysaccharide deacetylase family protein [Synechococcus sp. Edmonson 11F2]MCP9856058.1 polysaccharide deacetylase family protein [Synechococcus sp. Cruz-9C9]MCP9863342.1 polysaccharide deacetylase family protein [Synechococcus sp. Cruz-7E5]MCP9870631.1 polysaccharide deacetylase family protein [Synechococcus sp. 
MSSLIVTGAAILSLLGLAALIVLWPTLVIRHVIAPLSPGVLFRVQTRQRLLALTIDDGPSGVGSDALLDLLGELGVPATFFLIGSNLRRNPQFARRAVAEGHQLGNHLWVDSRSALLPRREFLRQCDGTERRIRRCAAPLMPALHWLRPGGGWFHPPLLAWAAALHYRLVLGSIFPWDTFQPPAWFLRWFILANAHPGGILVLHDTPELSRQTLATLRQVVPELKQQGYRFVDLDTLSGPAGPGWSC